MKDLTEIKIETEGKRRTQIDATGTVADGKESPAYEAWTRRGKKVQWP